jgi:hypothetical protein
MISGIIGFVEIRYACALPVSWQQLAPSFSFYPLAFEGDLLLQQVIS